MPTDISDVQKACKLAILVMKRDILPPIVGELNQKIQALEEKVRELQDQLSKNESVLRKKIE